MMLALLIATVPIDPPPLTCVDAKGVPVQWTEDDFIKDLAQALFSSAVGGVKRPTVQYNPGRLKRLHEKTRLFFLAHECGHHVLGHLYGGIQGQDKEQQADCYAIHRMQADGTLGDDLDTIARDLGDLGRMDKNHPAGSRRGGNLTWCLKDPPPKPVIQPDLLPRDMPASEPAPVEPPKKKKKGH